jgi:nucleotide-binding universal stress UspA family protein
MSVFPSKILVATDGSGDAVLAVRAAVDLSNETGAELHVVHVGESLAVYPPPASGPPQPTPSREEIHQVAQRLLDAQVEQIAGMGAR